MVADDQRTNTTALREALAAATPGPWAVTKRGIEGNVYDDVIAPGSVECMSHCYGGSSTVEGDRYDEDRALIVAAVNTLPALLDELDTVRADLDTALATLTRVRELLGTPSPPRFEDGPHGKCFVGLASGDPDRHRTVGPHRAWSHTGEWCYPEMPCGACSEPIHQADLRAALDGSNNT